MLKVEKLEVVYHRVITAVQGIVFTIGIEMMLAGDIVVAADDCRF